MVGMDVGVYLLFNYGEHYNWFDSDILRMDVLLFVVTGYFCIQRMRHIRHPYIAPEAWKYKRLVPLLILFAFVEWMGSTPKVLQTALRVVSCTLVHSPPMCSTL